MTLPRSGPKWMEWGLYGAAGYFALNAIVSFVQGPLQPTSVVMVFFFIGLALVFPPLVAGMSWAQKEAIVTAREEGDEAAKISFEYKFDSETYLGHFSATTNKQPNDKIQLWVNPRYPKEHFVRIGVKNFIGWVFLFVSGFHMVWLLGE